jgi:hypothetical protein
MKNRWKVLGAVEIHAPQPVVSIVSGVRLFSVPSTSKDHHGGMARAFTLIHPVPCRDESGAVPWFLLLVQ